MTAAAIQAVSIQPSQDPTLVEIDPTDISAVYEHTSGPYIEAVNHPSGAVMYCNEDGHMKRLPANAVATSLFKEAGVNIYGGVVLGGILVVGPVNEEGWNESVPADLAKRLVRGKE